MIRRTSLLAAALLLGAPLLIAQVPPEERIPITDPDRLKALGFPRDAKNVAGWSKADPGRRSVGDAPGMGAAESDTFGTRTGYTNVSGYELLAGIESIKLGRFTDETECYENPTNIEAWALAPIQVPEGARLTFFRFWALDHDPDLDLTFQVLETCQAAGLGPPAVTLIGESFTFGSIGNYSIFASLHDLTVNNRDCTYTVRVRFADSGVACSLNLRVRKLQFSWHRQVSPAPSTATFNDVPTSHPFFRFIEALRDSGITGGCDAAPPLYCPEAPITRGQMAVFLATALGLSWP